jgi:nucleoside-diphosphate-sugar epimerase
MKVLVIGGTRFVGYGLVWRLLFEGHQVTMLNRGRSPDPFGDRVFRLNADRHTVEFGDAVRGRRFDAAVDFLVYTADDARSAVDALDTDQYVMISTGSVYLVRLDCPVPSRESDYAGPIMAAPPTPGEEPDWRYSVDKRAAEDVLTEAWNRGRFPSTRVRIPIVNGERDYSRRLESYLWRILDGGPLVLPEGGRRCLRHVYSGAVVEGIMRILGQERALGQAYNLAQDEIPTLAEMLEMLAEELRAPLTIVPVGDEMMRAAGLERDRDFPFTGHWTSILDPGRAKLELGFRHPPLREYLGKIAASFMASIPDEPPAYYRQRRRELALAAELTR